MTGTLEKLSRELSLNVSSDYIRNKLEAYGVFRNNFRQSKTLRISPTSSLDPCSPEKLPSDPAANALSPPVRTTQLVYYVKNGKEYRGLCEPRAAAYSHTQHTHSTLPMWPVEVDCVNFRPKFIHSEPEEREPLHLPDAPVPTPPVLSAERKGHVVYMNHPGPAQWFTSARQGPNLSSVGFAQRDSDDISLSFESRFESGNLSKAVQVGKWEYELYLRPDLYTGKHTQWYYFGVRNMRPGHTYRFTITNFYKAGSLYNNGMQPLMYSERQAAKGVGWRRVGNNIKYFKTNVRREGIVTERFYYALTWTCRFPVSGDTCYFAHCFPYTYSDLKDYLQRLTGRPEVNKFCKQRTLCHTIAGNPVPVVTIAAPSSSMREVKAKKAVVITARVHPGESNASWMMKGLLDFLTSSHSDAQLLREMFVFKVVPMLNPDGVIIGNYRCSLAGRDLNRNYRSDLKEAYPTVWYVKAMVQKLVKEREVVMYCDLHGHSRRQDVFIYGCVGLPGKGPGYNLLSRVFPKMMSLNTPDKFSYKYSSFSVRKSKEGTGRVAMWRQMGILNSFTMEATFCGSNLKGKCQNRHFTMRDFEAMGYHFCDTLLDYCDPDQSNVEFVLQGLREERRKEILEQLARVGVDVPPDTDPLDLEEQLPQENVSSSDEGSDSSVSDGAPLGPFSLKPSPPTREERRRRKQSKKRRKSKSKRSSVHHIPKLKMVHKEAKSVDDPESVISVAASTQNEPIPMETKLKLPSTQPSRPAGVDSRKDSATSSVSMGRGPPTPTVQYKHRLSGTGGVPINVQERLEERQRRRSDAETSQPTISGFGSEASVHLEPSWSLQRLQNLAPATIQDYWRSYNQPLTVSALLPQKADGVEDGPSHFTSDRSLPQMSLSHLHHGRDSEMLPTDSAHLMATQMKEIMEKCNLPLNPTNNLVSLSRFFRQARPLGGNRKVYMDMVRSLRRPNLSQSSLHQTERGREERGGSRYSLLGEDSSSRLIRSGEEGKRSQLAPTTEEALPTATATATVEHNPASQQPALSHEGSHDISPEKTITRKDSLPLLPASRSVISARHSPLESPEDDILQVDSGEIPDDVIDDSDFNLEIDEGGYDSDSESESDEGEDPVGGTSESHPPNALLPRNISEKVLSLTVEEKTAPVPKSFSVPSARSRTATTRPPPASSTPPIALPLAPPMNNDKQGWLAGESQPRPQTSATETAGLRLGSALIRGPDIRRHKDKVAAAVEALEGMQQANERLASCKTRRPDPYSTIPEGSQQREMGLPTAVLFTGSSLVGTNPLRITEQPTTQNTATTTGARDTESTQPTTNNQPPTSSSLPKWQKPPPSLPTVDRGERLPQLVNHRSDPQGISRGRQNGEKQGGERGESGRGGVWPSVSCDNQPSRPATRGCFGRPSTSMSSSLQDGGIVPKSVTLDFPPRVLHTSHSRTRPVL